MEREYCFDFAAYENQELDRLIGQYGRQVSVPKGTYFIKPGDTLSEISYLYRGKTIHTVFNALGQEKISYSLTHGWFLSEGIFSYDSRRSIAERYSYAKTELLLYKIDESAYDTLIAYPIFVNAIIRSLNKKRSFLNRELESVSLARIKERLKKFLTLLSDPAHPMDSIWYPLTHNYTHQDMAAILGTNRVTVSRFISELAAEGFLRVVNRRIQINRTQMKGD